MGHREQLLAGAKQCIYDKGLSATTARDIVAASGANLASIGYHFGSKDALLTEAMIEALSDWTEATLETLTATPKADPMEQFEAVWSRVIASFDDNRPAVAASFEVGPLAERFPEVRKRLAEGHEAARLGMAALMLGIDPAAEPQAARTVGSFYLALMIGLLAQMLIDPQRSPTGTDLAHALRIIVDRMRLAQVQARPVG